MELNFDQNSLKKNFTISRNAIPPRKLFIHSLNILFFNLYIFFAANTLQIFAFKSFIRPQSNTSLNRNNRSGRWGKQVENFFATLPMWTKTHLPLWYSVFCCAVLSKKKAVGKADSRENATSIYNKVAISLHAGGV